MAESDEELMQRTSRGDLAALGELFDRHQPAVHAFLCRFLGDATLAEDVAQEVFWRVWRYRHSFNGTAPFTSWLYGIARRAALTEARRPHRRELSLDDPAHEYRQAAAEDPDGAVSDAAMMREQVRRALEELPPEQRLCLVLREFDDHSYQEIAALLGCSPEKARVLAFRARRALRRLLESRLHGEESYV